MCKLPVKTSRHNHPRWRCLYHKGPNMSSRQNIVKQIPLNQSWKKVSTPEVTRRPGQKHNSSNSSLWSTQLQSTTKPLITQVNFITTMQRTTMPNRETPTNYIDAELLHTASTEYAITRISAFQSPQKNKKNLSTPKPPTTMISKARHTARPYALYKRPCTEGQGPMQFDSVTWTNQGSNLQEHRRTSQSAARSEAGYQERSCFPSNRLPRNSSSCSGVCLTYFPGALLFSMRGPKRFWKDLYAGNRISATASLSDSRNSESGTDQPHCF